MSSESRSEFLTSVSVDPVEFCFQYLASSSSEYVDLSAMALELQKLYRQVPQSSDLVWLELKQRW